MTVTPDLPVAALRRHLLPFWSDAIRTLREPGASPASPAEPIESGMCVVTAFLLERALPVHPGIGAVSGKFRDIRTRNGWTDHSMLRIGDTLLDLTQAQFPGRPEGVLMPLQGAAVAVQTTTRINPRKAPDAALFVTLLNRPNPIGWGPVSDAFARRNPETLTALAALLAPFSERLASPR